MDALLQQIERILSEQLTCYEALLTDATKMNAAIKGNDLEGIHEITCHYDIASTAIESLENERIALFDQFFQAQNQNVPDHRRLSSLVQNLTHPKKTIVLELGSKLRSLLTALSRINKENEVLINETMHAIRDKFETIKQLINRNSVYKNSGEINTKRIQPSLFTTTA